jgi:hypothetical protein
MEWELTSELREERNKGGEGGKKCGKEVCLSFSQVIEVTAI